MQYLLEEQREKLDSLKDSFEKTLKSIVHALNYFQVGDVVQVPSMFGKNVSWGVFTGVSIRHSSANPYTLNNISLVFATTDERKSIAFKIGGRQRELISHILTRSNEIEQAEKDHVLDNWNTLTAQDGGQRSERHIITGNILTVSDIISQSNKLIKYNKIDGIIENGILLHKNFVEQGDHLTKSPISKAFKQIKALKVDEMFFDASQEIRFLKISESLYKVYLKKRGNMDIYTDERLRYLLEKAEGQNRDELAEFVQNAAEMMAILSQKRLKPFLKALDQFNIVFFTEAEKLEKWEARQSSEQTSIKKGNYRYRLSMPLQQASYPDQSFKRYDPADDKYPYGLLVYDFPLSIDQRKADNLIPVFQNPLMALQRWNNAEENQGSIASLNKQIEKLKEAELPLLAIIDQLGQFLFDRLGGEQEAIWWFGNLTIVQMGRAIYEEHIKKIEPIDEYIEQLATQLQLVA